MSEYEVYSIEFPYDRKVKVYVKLPSWEYKFVGIGEIFQKLTGINMMEDPSSQGYKLLYHGRRTTLPEDWRSLGDLIVCGEE